MYTYIHARGYTRRQSSSSRDNVYPRRRLFGRKHPWSNLLPDARLTYSCRVTCISVRQYAHPLIRLERLYAVHNWMRDNSRLSRGEFRCYRYVYHVIVRRRAPVSSAKFNTSTRVICEWKVIRFDWKKSFKEEKQSKCTDIFFFYRNDTVYRRRRVLCYINFPIKYFSSEWD